MATTKSTALSVGDSPGLAPPIPTSTGQRPDTAELSRRTRAKTGKRSERHQNLVVVAAGGGGGGSPPPPLKTREATPWTRRASRPSSFDGCGITRSTLKPCDGVYRIGEKRLFSRCESWFVSSLFHMPLRSRATRSEFLCWKLFSFTFPGERESSFSLRLRENHRGSRALCIADDSEPLLRKQRGKERARRGDYKSASLFAASLVEQRHFTFFPFLLLSANPAMKYAHYLKGVEGKAPLLFRAKFIE